MFSTLIVSSLLGMSFTVRVPLKTQKTNHGIKVLRPNFSLYLGHQTRFLLSQVRVASTWTSDVQCWWRWRILNLYCLRGHSNKLATLILYYLGCWGRFNSLSPTYLMNNHLYFGNQLHYEDKGRVKGQKKEKRNSLFEQNLRRSNSHKLDFSGLWKSCFLNLDGGKTLDTMQKSLHIFRMHICYSQIQSSYVILGVVKVQRLSQWTWLSGLKHVWLAHTTKDGCSLQWTTPTGKKNRCLLHVVTTFHELQKTLWSIVLFQIIII